MQLPMISQLVDIASCGSGMIYQFKVVSLCKPAKHECYTLYRTCGIYGLWGFMGIQIKSIDFLSPSNWERYFPINNTTAIRLQERVFLVYHVCRCMVYMKNQPSSKDLGHLQQQTA